MCEIYKGSVSFFNDFYQFSWNLNTKESLGHIEKKLK